MSVWPGKLDSPRMPVERVYWFTRCAACSAGALWCRLAYRLDIAPAAAQTGRFVPHYSLERLTWIKPSSSG